MRADLCAWHRVQAELLLTLVRETGCLSAAARSIGMPEGTARLRWRQWGLSSDFKLRVGSKPINHQKTDIPYQNTETG